MINCYTNLSQHEVDKIAVAKIEIHAISFAHWCVTENKTPNVYHWKQYAKKAGLIERVQANFKY